METKRRWSGYVCPDCRFVFRIPKDHDGLAVVCPSCRRMLKIPSPEDVLPPLTTAQATGQRQEVVPLIAAPALKRPDLEEAFSAQGHHRERKLVGQTLLGGVCLLGALLVTAFFIFRDSNPGGGIPTALPAISVADVPEPVGPDADLVPEALRNGNAYLISTEALARKFLTAETVEEVLSCVRNPAEVEPKIRAYYPDGKIAAPGLAVFNPDGVINQSGKSVTIISLLTATQESRYLAFVETPEGIKVDWESWVGWSEMTWQDFRKAKPTSGKLFRVILSAVDYYNFAFTDEAKWQSYRLVSPNGADSFYGYVERTDPVNRELRPDEPTGTTAMTVLLKFPPGTNSENQVIIEKVIANGWVETTDAP